MGLSSTLSNALSGMNASQRGLEVISRNVANQGTPGYHRQSVVLEETHYGQASQVRMASVQRAFDEALHRQHVVSVSQSAYHGVRAQFLDRLQVALGKPGDSNSLDTLYTQFENALQALATTPDDMASRAQVLNDAQAMVERLNGLSGTIQEMRRESEFQIANAVAGLNRDLANLADVNVRILDLSQDQTARLAMLDERDRLVASIAEKIDVTVTYRDNGTVSLMTKGGVGLLDNEASAFEFALSGSLSPTGGVGRLEMITPGGRRIDMSGQITGGGIAGLLELRDNTLVNAQNQLDEIAAGLAMAMSTLPADTGVSEAGGVTSIAHGDMLAGNGFALTYLEGGVEKTVRVINAQQTNADPGNVNAAGERVITVDFSDPAAAAAVLDTALGSAFDVADSGTGAFEFTPTGATLQEATTRITATGTQGAGLALPLFVDRSGKPFSGSLDGTGQTAGFAARIALNKDLVSQTELLVRTTGDTAQGDPGRPQFLLENLRNMTFTSESVTDLRDGGVRLSGRVGDLITQTINYQGDTVARGFAQSQASAMTLEAVNTRMEASYGVNVDEEMARLMELQNAYAASARVVSTVQELIDRLLAM